MRSKGVRARELKATVVERKQIEVILASPEKQLKPAERQILWTYRYTLTDKRHVSPTNLQPIAMQDLTPDA